MILATAGHVNHGKTTLVRVLTGVDTDRLPEEKRRGMTIEPGYAHADLGGGEAVSFVDVPGHEGFLRQAIVGLAAVDAALLVVACDDGPMPQTREHLALLHLLGIRRGAVVLTKADRVSADRVAEVSEAMHELLQATTLAGAPTFVVSSSQGQGIEALREGLRLLQHSLPVRAPHGAFRLAVDRAFTRPGIGTVAAGTVLSGHVRAGDSLCVSPSGQPVRVRGVQSQGHEVEFAAAGQRCALALAGVERKALTRGTWLMAAALHAPTLRIDVHLTLLPTAPRPIADHADLQLHLGATALPVRVLPLHPRRLVPGASGFAQLVLHTPVSALHGDRFVLRDPSAHALVGGGTVLDASAPLRGRASESRIAELQALETDNAAQALASSLQLRADGVDETSFARQRNLDAAALTHLRCEVRAQSVSTRAGTRLMATDRWAALLQAALHAVTMWHADQPASLGMPEPALLNAMRTATGVNDKKLCQAAVRAALDNGSIEHSGHVLRRPGHEARLAPDDAALLQQVHLVMQPMGLRPPPLGDLAVLLGLPLQDTAVALQRMATLGHLVQVAKNRFFLPQTLQALMQIARDTAAAAPEGRFDAASFRDRSGVGRNLSIQLLEFFDRVGFTRYANEWRVIAE